MPPFGTIPLDDLYRLLVPVTVPTSSPTSRFSNWGQTFHCTPLAVFEPETESQCKLILELARREGKGVRAAGVGHSPSDLACTNEFMLRTTKLNQVLEVHTDKLYVVVQPGIILHDLHAQLQTKGLAMKNVGSISDQTLGGIVTTATHGTGINYGVISTHVLALTMLLADGTRIQCSRQENEDLFLATLCGLGATGLIVDISLAVEPAYHLKEVQKSVPFNEVIQRLDSMAHSVEHFRFWWFPAADTVRLSFSNRSQEAKRPAGSWLWHSLMGFHVVQLLLFLGRYLLTINTWTTRFACWLVSSYTVGIDDGYRIFNVECRYTQYTTEWAVPFTEAESCLRDLRDWYDKEQADPNGIRPHFPVEVRFSSSDDIWLSPSYGQKTCWIGIVQYKPYGFVVPYKRAFEGFETILLRHKGRPHWAKAHRLQRDYLRTLYPRFDDFVRVIEQADPQGMFRNAYVQRHILGNWVDGRVFKLRQTKEESTS